MTNRTCVTPLPSVDLRDRAYRLYQAGDVVEAERICNELLASGPGHAESVYLLAVIALDRGQSEESYARFSEAARLAPRMPFSQAHWARPISARPLRCRHCLFPSSDRLAAHVQTRSQ